MSELTKSNGYEIANNVRVGTGQSWFSPHMELQRNMPGVSYEVKLKGNGTGSFVPRGGNRARHQRGGEVVTTPTTDLDGERLPQISGILSTDLPDITTAPFEKTINIGNINCNYAELEFKCLTGTFFLTVIAAGKAA